jgi:hypothetical protein
MLKSYLTSENYPEGSKYYRKIPRHDLAPNELKKIFRSFNNVLSTSNKKILFSRN